MEELELLLARRKLFQAAKSPEEIKVLYEKTLADFPVRYMFSTMDYAEQKIPDILQRRDFFNEHVGFGKIIDIGSGDGYFSIELAKSGREIVGVDMLAHRVLRAQEKAKKLGLNASFLHGYAENIPLESKQFDTAILSHMLEHVYNPVQVLLEAARVTKTNGRIIAIVPPIIGKDPTHIRCIQSNELKLMLEQFGPVSQEYVVGTKGIGYICTVLQNSFLLKNS
jgi:SAM-dependent methyltransferase